MYRPSLRSIWTLIILAAICFGLYEWSERSHIEYKLPNYTEKVAAAKLMDRALRSLQNATMEAGVFPDEAYDDPRLTAIIGQQFSLITTDFDVFESKLVGANPNFAAVAVDLLKQADVQRGDLVAVGYTGSQPGVNLAVLCACEALGVIPVTITSVGASWWGANHPDYTWPDMERYLNQQGILYSRPVAASLGGAGDKAVGLSKMGQDLIREAISRNGLELIHEDNLPADIARRIEAYHTAAAGKAYKAFVTAGQGEADLGHEANARLIGSGYQKKLPVKNYPSRGVIHAFNSEDVPIINLSDVSAIGREYGLGGAQMPLPEVGQGDVYVTERYDLRVAGISALIALALILVLVRLDAKLFRLKEAGVDPDTLM